MIGFDKIIAESIRKVLLESEQDGLYFKAYRDNDTDTAMRMVLQAAKTAMPNTKVVDNNGNPKIVVHGTPNEFNEFDEGFIGSHNDAGWLGTGFYFYGNNRDYASSYSIRIGKDGKFEIGNVMNVFLNIERPYDANEEEFGNLSEIDSFEESLSFTEDRKEDGNDGVFYNGDSNEEWVAYYPSQIKSAEPFTFDDSGNLIPLSQRFDFSKNDIRY